MVRRVVFKDHIGGVVLAEKGLEPDRGRAALRSFLLPVLKLLRPIQECLPALLKPVPPLLRNRNGPRGASLGGFFWKILPEDDGLSRPGILGRIEKTSLVPLQDASGQIASVQSLPAGHGIRIRNRLRCGAGGVHKGERISALLAEGCIIFILMEAVVANLHHIPPGLFPTDLTTGSCAHRSYEVYTVLIIA